MAMRAAATKAAVVSTAAPRGLRALYSSLPGFSFNLPPAQVEKPPPAEPSTNLFVSGLSKRTTTEGLLNAFAKFGEVVSAKVVTDRVSGYSKGFGFVNYATLEGAEAGIKGMDGQVFLMDPWWHPAVEWQSQDRIHRIGPIRIVRFIIENTAEERILRLQEKKELVFEGTVGGSSEALANGSC